MSFLDRFRAARPVRIEALAPGHAARLCAIHASAFARPWEVSDFERMLGERAILADGLFLNADASPAGFILSRIVLDEAEVLTLAIAPRARGRGHGRTLLLGHIEALARRGVARLHLEVEEGNAAALALYRRAGFEETGRRANYYMKADGTRMGAITMARTL